MNKFYEVEWFMNIDKNLGKKQELKIQVGSLIGASATTQRRLLKQFLAVLPTWSSLESARLCLQIIKEREKFKNVIFLLHVFLAFLRIAKFAQSR